MTRKTLVTVCAFLLVSNLITFFFLNKSKKETPYSPNGETISKDGLNPYKQANLKYPYIDPAREFIPQKDFLIGRIQPLRQYLEDLGEKIGPENISIYYEQLNSGSSVNINKYLRLFPASLTKLPLGMVVVKKIEEKDWNWDTKIEIQQQDIDQGSGSLYKEVTPGDKVTVEKLLESLISDSDNTAQKVFLRTVEKEELVEFQIEAGLEDLFDEKGFISAKEYARVLRVLYTSSFLERENSQKILDCLAKEKFQDYLSQGIPENTVFAHKYGENKDQSIFADAGIVYVPGRPYMITVIYKGKDSTPKSREEAVKIMEEISEKTYEYSTK